MNLLKGSKRKETLSYMLQKDKMVAFFKYHLMYHTKRHTQVKSLPIGFTYRLAQFVIIFYILV